MKTNTKTIKNGTRIVEVWRNRDGQFVKSDAVQEDSVQEKQSMDSNAVLGLIMIVGAIGLLAVVYWIVTLTMVSIALVAVAVRKFIQIQKNQLRINYYC
jgi:hypothetical protein